MSTLRIDLLRHGETEAGQCFLGRTDAALTDRGWQQMHAALESVRPQNYERVFSSPLQRCRTFAEQWAGPEGFVTDARLREYDFGQWDGQIAAHIHATDPAALGRFWQDPWHCPPPEAESLADFFARLEALVDQLQQEHARAVLLICHGGVIRALHCILNGLPVSEMFSFPVAHGSLHQLQDARQ